MCLTAAEEEHGIQDRQSNQLMDGLENCRIPEFAWLVGGMILNNHTECYSRAKDTESRHISTARERPQLWIRAQEYVKKVKDRCGGDIGLRTCFNHKGESCIAGTK